MRCLLLFYVISFIVSVSVSYHIGNKNFENTIPSSDDGITVSTVETSVDTEVWDEFSNSNITSPSFTETSYMSTNSITNTNEATLYTEIWDDFSTYVTESSAFTEASDLSTDDTSSTNVLSSSEENSDESIQIFSIAASFMTSTDLLEVTGISKRSDNSSATEPTTTVSGISPLLLTSTGGSSINTVETEAHLASNITLEPNTTGNAAERFMNFSETSESSTPYSIGVPLARNITLKPNTTGNAAEHLINFPANSESSTAYSTGILNISTNEMSFIPEVISSKVGDHAPELNTVETETAENKGPKCGQKFTRIPRIIGGIRSLAGEFPWMVSVRVLTSHYCGGVIVNKDWILTAGHCVRRFAARYWRIRLGGHDVNIDEFRPQWDIPVSKIIVHPKFGSPAKYSYDMALMKLQRSIKYTDFAAPICLPQNLDEAFDGANATVIGWGRTNEGVEEKTPFLQKAYIPVINNSVCAEWYRKVHYGYIRVRDYHICAGLREGGRDACKGDSGGPLVMENGGRYILLGITSAGVGCGRSQLPGVYSRATYFVPWILKVTGGYTLWPSEEDYDEY